jgi:predicted nucleic acid-binding protein
MNLFWDTSALVALLFEEPHSAEAERARASTTTGHAWRWIRVEAAAAMSRRDASDERWARMEGLLASLRLIDLSPDDLDVLCRVNRTWRLRAADAGHLHCFRRAAYAMPDLQLVTFDDEMVAAARTHGLPLWQPGADSAAPPLVCEPVAGCLSGRERHPAPTRRAGRRTSGGKG